MRLGSVSRRRPRFASLLLTFLSVSPCGQQEILCSQSSCSDLRVSVALLPPCMQRHFSPAHQVTVRRTHANLPCVAHLQHCSFVQCAPLSMYKVITKLVFGKIPKLLHNIYLLHVHSERPALRLMSCQRPAAQLCFQHILNGLFTRVYQNLPKTFRVYQLFCPQTFRRPQARLKTLFIPCLPPLLRVIICCLYQFV